MAGGTCSKQQTSKGVGGHAVSQSGGWFRRDVCIVSDKNELTDGDDKAALPPALNKCSRFVSTSGPAARPQQGGTTSLKQYRAQQERRRLQLFTGQPYQGNGGDAALRLAHE